MTSTNDIRAAFLDYFRRHDHEIVPSGPLVPADDPTLMFANAGMVPFKNVFTGAETRAYTRAASSQKCVRAGGKHNDLDNVGYTARHHTFFEMLGNFSFGDYFKEKAIVLAWAFLTKELQLPPDRLLVTVYAEDDEAHQLWRKVAALPENRLRRIAAADNFWSMGATGPCGPCSEIFYDHGPDIPGGPPGSPDEDGDRFVEIWNLVFMQYETRPGGERVDLPRPSIDTGMGLERIAAVLQGVHDNYQIDLFQSLVQAVAKTLGDMPPQDKAGPRVIADHLRACGFLITDGVLPSNEGRGYVLRRIMRRAMRHAQQLGAREPLMYKLTPVLIAEMGAAFPELQQAEALITETLRGEETRFQETLERGLRLLDDEMAALSDGGVLPGQVAFKLYDTYGFPVDLTADVLRGRGFSLDQAGFEKAMEKQKAEARASWKGSGEKATDEIWFAVREDAGPTEFLGYERDQASAEVLAILRDGRRTDSAKAGDEISLIVNQTPFYAESGGQLGDRGLAENESGIEIEILDIRKRLGDVFEHVGKITTGTLRAGDILRLSINTSHRAALRANHSATHLLHAALRRRLGAHVTQKGSLVAPDRLRFDISHSAPLSDDDIRHIEAEVNARVRQNSPVETRLMAPADAVALGAMALFGEKYGDEVRVVSMGHDGEGDNATPFSLELCGGTHAARTGDIGYFVVTSEQAVGSGLRRVEALTGASAEHYLDRQRQILHQATRLLKTPYEQLPDRLAALNEERKQLERDLADTRRKMASGSDSGASREIAGVAFAARCLEGVPARDLKPMADEMKKSLGSAVIALAGSDSGKASLVVAVTDDLTNRFNAVDLVRAGSAALGGKGGGGRPDMAQAGGPDAQAAQKALDAVAAAMTKAGGG